GAAGGATVGSAGGLEAGDCPRHGAQVMASRAIAAARAATVGVRGQGIA
ncbi:MAG: hypothetical protein RL527_1151, partial [Planctomycetota bacterium]